MKTKGRKKGLRVKRRYTLWEGYPKDFMGHRIVALEDSKEYKNKVRLVCEVMG